MSVRVLMTSLSSRCYSVHTSRPYLGGSVAQSTGVQTNPETLRIPAGKSTRPPEHSEEAPPATLAPPKRGKMRGPFSTRVSGRGISGGLAGSRFRVLDWEAPAS